MTTANQFSTSIPRSLEQQLNQLTETHAPGASFPIRLRALMAEVLTYRSIYSMPPASAAPIALPVESDVIATFPYLGSDVFPTSI